VSGVLNQIHARQIWARGMVKKRHPHTHRIVSFMYNPGAKLWGHLLISCKKTAPFRNPRKVHPLHRGDQKILRFCQGLKMWLCNSITVVEIHGLMLAPQSRQEMRRIRANGEKSSIKEVRGTVSRFASQSLSKRTISPAPGLFE